MKQRKNLNPHLTRRSWIVLATSTLAGCGGGGSSSSTASMPGTGGTGIYAQGSISGFGSVIMNGIKFDDTAAKVQVDGVTATSADLRLGMVAAVQGERNAADVTLGTASSIQVWSVAQGVVSQVGSGEFTLAGMTVQTDSTTVFDGIANAAALSLGLRVAVWGLQAGADGTRWTATRVAVVPATAVVSTGLVSVADSQRSLNGLLLTGPDAGSLTAGQLVRVQGALSAAGDSLALASFKLLGSGVSAQPQGEIEIEGLVTTIPSAGRFMLGSIEVDASSAVYNPVTAQITLGARVEVYGSWQSGVLKATEVELETEQALHAVEISGLIEQFTSLANFVVREQRCDATNATISHGTVADLRVGVQVKVKGAKAGGDVLVVTELEIGG